MQLRDTFGSSSSDCIQFHPEQQNTFFKNAAALPQTCKRTLMCEIVGVNLYFIQEAGGCRQKGSSVTH